MERGIKFTKENIKEYSLKTIVVILTLTILLTPFVASGVINLQECWDKFNNHSLIEKILFSYYGLCLLIMCVLVPELKR